MASRHQGALDDRRTWARWGGLAFALAITAIGCSDGRDGDDSDAGVAPVELDPCGFAEPAAATIDVAERNDSFHAGTYGRVGASVHEGPEPALHEVVQEEGECRYLRAALGFCDPACGAGDLCTIEGECRPLPLLVSGGTLTFAGLGEDIAIEPEEFAPGTYVGPGGLPDDLFDEGDVVGARLSGDVFPATSLSARGVAPVDADLTGTGLDLVDGQDAQIVWTPGSDSEACVQVVLNGFNQTHGAPLSDIIRCESSDDGSLLVPRSMVDAFPVGDQPQVTEGYDWPHSELTRYTRSTRSTEQGPASLVVHGTTTFLLRHAR